MLQLKAVKTQIQPRSPDAPGLFVVWRRLQAPKEVKTRAKMAKSTLSLDIYDKKCNISFTYLIFQEDNTMSLFSKLLKAATDKDIDLDKLAKGVTDAAEKFNEQLKESGAMDQLKKLGEELESKSAIKVTEVETPKAQAYSGELAPAGTWWGELMPDEENQYNSGLDYLSYFRKIFAEDFAEYTIEEGEYYGLRNFSFMKDGEKALVVELLPGKSNAQGMRKACRASGTPYLRFYYDVEGWWNARAYVVQRIKGAL
jgi:hypothetical protein